MADPAVYRVRKIAEDVAQLAEQQVSELGKEFEGRHKRKRVPSCKVLAAIWCKSRTLSQVAAPTRRRRTLHFNAADLPQAILTSTQTSHASGSNLSPFSSCLGV